MAQKSESNFHIDPTTMLLLGGGLIAYFGVIKPAMDAEKKLLQTLGLKEDPKVKENDAKKAKAIQDEKDAVLKRQKPTKSAGNWQIVAESIYSEINSSFYVNFDVIQAQLEKVQNDADFILLYSAFKKRCQSFLGHCSSRKLDLTQWVQYLFETSRIKKMNDLYKKRGINYSF